MRSENASRSLPQLIAAELLGCFKRLTETMKTDRLGPMASNIKVRRGIRSWIRARMFHLFNKAE